MQITVNRIVSLCLAVVLALSSVMTGTLAWQSISQQTDGKLLGKADRKYKVTLRLLEDTSSQVRTQVLRARSLRTENEKPIPGATFYLYAEDGTQVGARYVTDEKGEINVELTAGKYYFEQSAPAPGYTFAMDEEGNPITRFDFEVSEEETSVHIVAAVNIRLHGNFTVQKIVENADSSVPLTEAQKRQAFTFTVTFSDGGAYDYFIRGGSNGSNGSSGTLQSGGTLTLRHGETAVFEKVDVGVNYMITEKLSGSQDFTVSSTGHQGTVTGDGNNAQFVNTFVGETGSLRIRKSVQGTDAGQAFNFVADIGGKTQSFTLKNGEEKVISNIPVGTEYTVREEKADGYTAAVEEYSGEVATAGQITLPFVNVSGFVPDPTQNGTITVTKNVMGADADPEREFTFQVTLGNGDIRTVKLKGGQTETITAPQGTSFAVQETDPNGYLQETSELRGTVLASAQTLTFKNHVPTQTLGTILVSKELTGEGADKNKEFTFEAVIGDETKTFTLKGGEVKAFANIPLGTEYTVKEKAADGYTAKVEQYSGTIAGQEQISLPFVNMFGYNPDSSKNGTITVTKNVMGADADPDREFTFRVTLSNGQVQTIQIKNGKSAQVVAPEGTTYTVKETNSGGYLPETEEVQGTVVSEPETLTFNNHVPEAQRDWGMLRVSKELTGDGADANKEFTFEAVIDGETKTFTLRGGEEKIFFNIPLGTEYTVSEQAADGYTPMVRQYAGTVVSEEEAVLPFVNVHGFTPDPTQKGTLILTKKVIGEKADGSKEFTFRVTLSDGTTQTIRLKGGQETAITAPEGTTYTVEETNPSGYLQKTDAVSGTVVTGSQTLSFENYVPEAQRDWGMLRVSKTLEGDGADANQEFTFEAVIGGKTRSFTLRGGEEKVISHIPVGTEYTVTEQAADGYTAFVRQYTGTVVAKEEAVLPFVNLHGFEPTPGRNGSVILAKNVVGNNADTDKVFTFEVSFAGGRTETVQLKDGEKTTITAPEGTTYVVKETDPDGYLQETDEVSGTVVSGSQTLTFTNRVPDTENQGIIRVSKTVEGDGADANKAFTFEAVIDGKTRTFSLKNGEEKVFANIPLGTEYTVTEQPADGYTAVVEQYTGTVVSGKKIELPFVNMFNYTPDPTNNGTVRVTKNVSGNNAADPDKEFTFEVSFAGGKTETVQLKNGDTKEFTAPEGTKYTVKETNSGGYLQETEEVSGMIVSTERTLTFNNYVPDTENQGIIRVSKTVEGDGADENKAFAFEAVIDGKTKKFSLKNGEEKVFSNIPLGTEYTVTEQPAEGYTAVVEQYTGTVVTEGEVTLPFVNKYGYTPDPTNNGTITVTKNVSGSNADASKEFTFEVTFTNGETETTETVQLKNGETKEFTAPEGTKYTVKETNPGGYLQETEEVSGMIVSTERKLTFNNYVPDAEKWGTIRVSKVLKGEFLETENEKLFHFTLFVNGVARGNGFDLKNGESREFAVPAGAIYAVQEDNYFTDEYVLTFDGGTGTALPGETIHAAATNTYIGVPKTLIQGKIEWRLDENKPASPPDSVTVYLKNGETTVDKKAVAKSNDGKWEYSFTVPKYATQDAEAIAYRIEQEPISGFATAYVGMNIINRQLMPVTVDPPVAYKLIQGNDAPKESFNFYVTARNDAPLPADANGENPYKVTVQTDGEENSIEFGSITFDNPGVYEYELREENSGKSGWKFDSTVYVRTVTVEAVTDGNGQPTGELRATQTLTKRGDTTLLSNLTFTNTYAPTPGTEQITVSGTKTWNHGSNTDLPTSIIVNVYGDGELMAQRQVTAKDDWKYRFDVPRYGEDGREIVYTVDETDVPNYTKTVKDYDITNTYQPGSQSADSGAGAKTGDGMKLWLCVTAMVLSGGGLVITSVIRRKRSHNGHRMDR